MTDLNFALMGCGRIAKKHAEILSRGHVPGARLCAVCDVSRERSAAFGKSYGVPDYGSVRDMVSGTPEIEVVNVLTPSGSHAQNAVEVARLGKHVVVEKPMALTIDDADWMIEECAAAGARLFVVKQNRYNKAVQALRRALEAGRLGKLTMGTVRVRWCRKQSYYDQDEWRGTWAHDGGVFCNQASHHIDLLEWMMGEPDSVFARATTALVDIETEDTGAAIFRFRNGALGIVEATTATRPTDLEGSLSLLGEKGSVVIGGFAVNRIDTWSFDDMSEEDERIVAEANQDPPDVYGFGHVPFMKNVVDCIRKEKPALVDGLEGRRSLELITAIYESIETGREVTLRFRPEKCRLGMDSSRRER
jgi:UDP-N-acetyl-2-amino-2-deoxyglucuronate dehydrogenase